MQVGALELLVTLWQSYPSEMLEIHGGGGLGGGAEGTPYSIYLLYWYKSTNTDAAGGGGLGGGAEGTRPKPYAILSILALLVQKHKY